MAEHAPQRERWRLADLAGRRVAVWGFGREGRAVIAALRKHLPQQVITLFCPASEAAAARQFDATLAIVEGEPDAALLEAFEVVVKSPGISQYKPAITAARQRGTQFTSGTALWFGENPAARVVGITGTKGKSTTSALLAHLARALGVRTALAGNIGLPLLELLDQTAELWVIELSSFQTGETGPIELGVVTSLYEEHLDWHGSRERYLTDKLKLADAVQALMVNGQQEALLERTVAHPRQLLFGTAPGWHVRAGAIHRGKARVFEVAALPLAGKHNALNACAALAALEALGYDAVAAASALASFKPLPHRLQRLGEHAGLHWINDSISTTPQATLAALESLPPSEVSVLIGGHDRGLDWSGFVEAMLVDPPYALICSGANGPRIAQALREARVAAEVVLCETLAQAIEQARALTPSGGYVLLSPGAPSFDQFHDYAERGYRFAELAGFGVEAKAGLEGLGIA